jgi:dihydroxyacetone kinase-like predicted kinase
MVSLHLNDETTPPNAVLTSTDLSRWCHRVRAATDTYRKHLNDINVIFDADWDTGENLSRLWSAAAGASELTVVGARGPRLPSEVLETWGAVDYALVGRSTRILKRMFQAMADATHDQPFLDSMALAEALAAAAAISDWDKLLPASETQPDGPQPGTILDVITAAAETAHRFRRAGLLPQLDAIAAAAQKATDATPSHHSVLRRIGAVDAGALGLSIALHELPLVASTER